ncbi:ankyrin repeat domain-containing protein [Salinisphaera sp. G21_0]|uniref:ankyrin repeat domain-containing protein n=1 Tax=Salinisphaera sp. G21_0 TaxID=2821094 RepID=UPI001B205904|nr:ankyrin repeat domain-containing protein [Salinisphaera sp. G21_0]MBO9481659.1 ankyrin repeat domain-containing protein [Salinisphaera sp. G21_0]
MNVLSGIRYNLIQCISPVSLHADVVEVCSVCLEDISGSRRVSVSICNHHYHTSCIKKWLKISKKANCPLCRRDLFIIADTKVPLHYAAAQGQQKTIGALIDRGANVNSRTKDGRTPLHYAAAQGQLEAIGALIARGGDVNSRTKDGRTPLHCAAEKGQLEAIGALIAKGADVNSRTKDERTPLHFAAEKGQLEAIGALIAAGADVNSQSKDGRTPLHCAAEKGHQEAIDALIARGANVNAQTVKGVTALKSASDCKKINIPMIKSFADAGFDVNAPCNNSGSTMLACAAEACDWGFVDELMGKGADINGPRNIRTKLTPLHYAAAQGQQEAIDALIARGADVNARTVNGDTALKMASDNLKINIPMIKSFANAGFDVNAPCNYLGSTMLACAAEACDWGFVDELMAKGADINGPKHIKTEYTPLHYAAEEGQLEAIKALIAKGADVSAQTEKGVTPLHYAAAQGQPEAIDALIAAGADVNARTKNGFTPLHYAAAQGQQEAIDALIANGADVNARSEKGYTALKSASDNEKINIPMIKSFADAGFDVNAPCNNLGSTMLAFAAAACDWVFVDKLLDKGADINGPKNKNTKYTPLHFAAEKGQPDAIYELIAREADVDARTKNGFTPLHYAAAQGHQEAIDALIEKGADVSARTKDGVTPLKRASDNKKINVPMIKSFVNAGFDVNAPGNNLDSIVLACAAAACDWELVDELVAKGTDINAGNINKYTPLHHAAEEGQQEAIDALIARGAYVDARTKKGATPLHYAAGKGQLDAIYALIANGADVSARTKDGFTPLKYATQQGQQAAVDALIAYAAKLKKRATGAHVRKNTVRQ